MNLPLIVLLLVLLLIAARKVGRFAVRIWQSMLAGALAVMVTGHSSPGEALAAINWDVMLFLFGMFVLGEALVRSGDFLAVSYRLLERLRSVDALVLTLLLGGGLASALLMNDTLAIIGTVLAVRLARDHTLPGGLMLMTLALAITTGSVMSPIGNPQNLLIATRAELQTPFRDFLVYLGPPTLASLLLAYGILRVRYRTSFHDMPLRHIRLETADATLAGLARLSLGLLLGLIAARVLTTGIGLPFEFRLSHIALGACLPLLLFSRRRFELLRRLDWPTLIFFASLFVLMDAVWRTGALQRMLPVQELSLPGILLSGVGVSQLISNVPLAALFLPLLEQLGATRLDYLALAAGTTLAGNLLVFGAASNIIILQQAEREGVHLGFAEFARVGMPVTLAQVLCYLGWLAWLS